MGWWWVASCRNRGQQCLQFPKRRTRNPRLMWLRRRLDEKPTSERLDVGGCFAPLLSWIVSWWEAQEQQLVLVDASARGARLTILSVSVVYRGGAMPVAWH